MLHIEFIPYTDEWLVTGNTIPLAIFDTEDEAEEFITTGDAQERFDQLFNY